MADLLRDQDLLDLARKEATALLSGDPELKDHRLLKEALELRSVRSAELVH